MAVDGCEVYRRELLMQMWCIAEFEKVVWLQPKGKCTNLMIVPRKKRGPDQRPHPRKRRSSLNYLLLWQPNESLISKRMNCWMLKTTLTGWRGRDVLKNLYITLAHQSGRLQDGKLTKTSRTCHSREPNWDTESLSKPIGREYGLRRNSI